MERLRPLKLTQLNENEDVDAIAVQEETMIELANDLLLEVELSYSTGVRSATTAAVKSTLGINAQDFVR